MKANRHLKIFLIITLAIAAYIGLDLFCSKQTQGFRPYLILSNLPNDSRWETPPLSLAETEEIHNRLNQTFTFLGSGGWCYAFLGEDQKTVLKFYKHSHLSLKEILCNFSFEKLLLRSPPWPENQPYFQEMNFKSCMLLYTQIKQRTGLIHVHLNKTKGLYPPVTLIDAIGIKHTIDLDQTEFLIQQRAEQAGTQLGQRQTEFTGGVERVGTGLQGIQERANVAQSAFQDPTRFVQSPENLKRFTALRTGQEKIPGVTETYGQIEPLRQGLTSQQRQIAEGLRTDVGQNLQEYIRSQRPNPALATLGETQLDRFLTEQTPSGLSAIESAVSRAGQIESEQTPAQEKLTQLESLRSQLAENPLVTQSGILNRLGEIYRPEEEFITNLNQEQAKKFIAQSLNGTAQSFDENLNELNRNIRKTTIRRGFNIVFPLNTPRKLSATKKTGNVKATPNNKINRNTKSR